MSFRTKQSSSGSHSSFRCQ